MRAELPHFYCAPARARSGADSFLTSGNFWGVLAYPFMTPDIDGTALKTGYINSFRITFQKQVAPTTLAPFNLDDV
jgi:hypothetical protein